MSLAGYYDESYPPELWETPAAPVAAAARSAGAEASSTVPGGTVLEASGPDQAEPLGVGRLPEGLVAHPGAPGTYSPALTAAARPRNVTELREYVTPALASPWAPGDYVPVGERGKRAHWTGEDWRLGEAPGTVPAGTVERA